MGFISNRQNPHPGEVKRKSRNEYMASYWKGNRKQVIDNRRHSGQTDRLIDFEDNSKAGR